MSDEFDLSKGAENDTAEEIIRKHLSPALRGPGWDAIIKALATGDAKVREFNALAFNQLYKSTASGVYLDRKAADDGVKRPPLLGMSDELFRRYAIAITASKLTHESVLQVLEVFYGSESVRAYSDAAVSEPFSLTDGAKLIVLVDEKARVEITFTDADFELTSQAKALEVALAITRAFHAAGLTAFALPIADPETGLVKVRIYSGARGLGSGVRVLGGLAQTVLRFPETIDVYSGALSGGPAWESPPPEPDTTPPNPPDNIVAAQYNPDAVIVTWNAPELDIASFKVYSYSGGSLFFLADTTEPQYIHETLRGIVNQYAIEAIDTSGNSSLDIGYNVSNTIVLPE